MANRCTRIPEIMFPREGVDLSKWAVIACDQYTSQPDYWAETDKTVGDAPSTLRLTLPEVYLEDADVAARTEKIHQTMQQYVQDGTLRTLPAGELAAWVASDSNQQRGECVLIIDAAPAVVANNAIDAQTEHTLRVLMAELPPKQAAKLTATLTGVPRDALYQLAVSWKQGAAD